MKIGEVWGWPLGRRDSRYVQPTCRCGTLYHHWATKIVVVLEAMQQLVLALCHQFNRRRRSVPAEGGRSPPQALMESLVAKKGDERSESNLKQ